MDSFEDTNCHSLSDSFSLYERYLRSFSVVDNFLEENINQKANEGISSSSSDYESSNSAGNIDLSGAIQTEVVRKGSEHAGNENDLINANVCDYVLDKGCVSLDTNPSAKVDSPCPSLATSLLDNSSITAERSLMTEKSEQTDVPISSEDSKPDYKQPVFITSTMENSNNAVDSVPMFRDVRHSESVFKLPISELSFNGTIKHIQKLKPIVDPISALSSVNTNLLNENEEQFKNGDSSEYVSSYISDVQSTSNMSDDKSSSEINKVDKTCESTGDSQYEELNPRKEYLTNENKNAKWNQDQSHSSLETSFDSGVRSPDMFSDEEVESAPEPFWNFLKSYEAYDKKKARKLEETLHGVLPPPSVTILRTDVTEMLKKYHCFLPIFNNESKANNTEMNVTPEKRVSLVQIPKEAELQESLQDKSNTSNITKVNRDSLSKECTKSDSDSSLSDKSNVLNICTELEAKETTWPLVMKCKYYDVYYNVTKHSEKVELLLRRLGERFVGAETDTSVSIHSGGMQSPSSASKRKALRLKLAQVKSPGRRLSHLARRRQAFCSAATISEISQISSSKMVLIDKNFFPHRKLITTAERRSPRLKRTPVRRTPGKKTPAKTPKSGGSSRKKVMRRLLMDSENVTKSQPTRETLKRALFVSPENRKSVPQASTSSEPQRTMKSRRMLFMSPDKTVETKTLNGTRSEYLLKRKLDALDHEPESSQSKIAKSLSFGGDTTNHSSQPSVLSRRASEVVTRKNAAELNNNHKQKLLWAVSEALRLHGWRMSSPGFREKASTLARLTRKLLTLPPHAAKLSAPKQSTSETMFKLARQYVFAVIQGRTVEECFQEEQMKLAKEANSKLTGYISASAYQQQKAKQMAASTSTSQIKENTCTDSSSKPEPTKSASKNILQDKLVNIDSNSNSSSGMSLIFDNKIAIYKSNSMPSFEEAAKMRVRRHISFDNVDFPKR